MSRENNVKPKKEIKFIHAVIPVLTLFTIIIYGMVIRPQVFNQPSLPLELVFIFSSIVTIVELFYLGFGWDEIQKSIIKKTGEALPAFYLLFSIGLIIGSWVISGTIPMFVYYGIKLINPSFLYAVAFILAAIFSLLTGTSWGSAGTIGIVLMGVGQAVDANLAVLAAAVIGGSYFGDKMSPLSDTTNMAALGAGTNLYDHIQSMIYTTGPSFIIASVLYIIMGKVYPAASADASHLVQPTLDALRSSFNFNILLLLPPVIVLLGAMKKKPSLPTLIASVIVASVISVTLQDFTLTDLFQTLYKGFNAEMITGVNTIPDNVVAILNRGGVYSLSEAVVITFMVFIYIGSIEMIGAMQVVVNRLFRFVRTRRATILASLISSSLVNGTTSNQYATSFIVGDAFKYKYDKLGIPRKVLSRSIEDYGTFIEPMLPWTTTGIYMVATLGVAYGEYLPFMFLQITNFIIAPLLAITGIGCFYDKSRLSENQELGG
ncbi:Na+/H+ antiporter NhaC [Maledivibacter halophilus]|uniref:Transporter, NhaC family n=1 Tax=Maledivibacter halophilus TaxID=36842 RepID=A0A1T5LU58_9FIRM|nr:Na+/H+ antiporter NhaC [Maledivibacter halophilus]SKC79139.1 transporter, NhaC family [Maledivibacter halophilus]